MESISDNRLTIANQFLTARRTGSALGEFPGELPNSLAEAYSIQDEAIRAWGKPILGWKVGRVAEPYASRFGVDRLAGPIFAVTMVDPSSATAEMPVYAGGFAAGEAEFLLRMGRSSSAGKIHFTLHEAAELIGSVHVGIEVASSPLATINALGPSAIISDFGNNNGLLVGPEIPNWRSSAFEDWEVSTRIDGTEVNRGRAAAFPDGALGSARFLLELTARRGIPLQAGQWISTGAITGVHEARAGQKIEARFGQNLEVCCIFENIRSDAG